MMFKKIAIFASLLGFVIFASGCCSIQPCATGVSCDPCGDMGGGCGGEYDTSCEQPCGTGPTACYTQCCFPNPLHWIGGLLQKACSCDSGCGELYWGGWCSYPPTCDPCDQCGHWVGDGGDGCYEGCSSPAGNCSDCQGTAGIPEGVEIISRTEKRMSSQKNPGPNRAPTRAAPRPMKKSPQARRPYYARPRR